jgi:hypothetical protein
MSAIPRGRLARPAAEAPVKKPPRARARPAGTSRNAHQRCSSRRGYQLVLGGHLAGERLEHPDLRPRHGDQRRAADEPVRYRVAGRREPHAREFVDLAAGRRAPISGRSDGSMPSSGRSCSSRCAGTAQISECTAALTSAPAGRRLVRRRRVADDGPSRHHQVTLGMADQVLHDPFDSGRPPGRSQAGARNASRTARRPRSGRPRWRRHRLSGSPSGQPASSWVPRRAPRSTRPAASASSAPANRTDRTRDQVSTVQNTCTPCSTPQSMTSASPGVHTGGRCHDVDPAPLCLRLAARRRKFRAEPAYPPAQAAGSSRLAEIFPRDVRTRSATSPRTSS